MDQSPTVKLETPITEIAGREDRVFRHYYLQASGLRFHLVGGGSGPTIVLLAGFPQSWYAWRRVMPILAKHFRVIAVDLPGQRDSEKPVAGYDTETTAKRVHDMYSPVMIFAHG